MLWKKLSETTRVDAMVQKTLWPAAYFTFAAATSFASTDYAPAIYREAYSGHWYTTGYGHHFAVIHDMEGYYLSTISYFQKECQVQNSDGTCRARASIHYCVNGLKDNASDSPAGEITQMVREAYWAWHVGCWNKYMWGTEHEGFASNPAWYTEAMYQASAPLQRHLMDQTVHPVDRNHVIGHNEWKSSAWKTWMAANYSSIDTSCNTHSDPGAYWDWAHFMQLVLGGPLAPSSLVLTPVSSTEIKLSWTDNSTNETGFVIERALSGSGPWTSIRTNAANSITYTNGGLTASTVYYYQVKAYNSSGSSGYTPVKSATTGNSAPTLNAIGGKTVTEGSALTFTAKATDPGLGATTTIYDFEGASSGVNEVMFRKPTFSSSTATFLRTAYSDFTTVTTSFPAGHSGTAVLKSTWSFNASLTNAWLRLTTSSAVTKPNPVIDFKQVLKFDIYSDKQLKVAVGCRETVTAAGTAIGADGGTSGNIEWAGATNSVATPPVPTRTINANTWTTVQFNLPFEPVRSFTGNGVLSTTSGLGVLEHLVFVPVGTTTTNAYTVYLDNFSVVYSNTLNYSLDAGAPAGASIDPFTGVFNWTPTEAQGPGDYTIVVRVTDSGSPPLDDFETITVSVNETNNASPTLAAISNKTVLAGDTLTFTNSASDSDLPADLTFSLDPGAPAEASIDPDFGIFTWTPPVESPDSTNLITVRVEDAGPPILSATRTFSVHVVSRTAKIGLVDGNGDFPISWSALLGKKYRLQYKNDLSDAEWTDASGDIDGTDGTVSRTVNVAVGTQRFYRIIEVP